MSKRTTIHLFVGDEPYPLCCTWREGDARTTNEDTSNCSLCRQHLDGPEVRLKHGNRRKTGTTVRRKGRR